MNLRTVPFMLLLASFLVAPQRMVAHHSEANFDHENVILMTGTITKMDFVNPHILLHFDVKKGDEVESWVGTTSSPNAMRRYGWTPASAKAGDKIEITGFLDREGRKIIQMAVNIVNGKTLAVSTTAERQLVEYKQRNPDKPFKKYN